MAYPILSALFVLSVALAVAFVIVRFSRARLWRKHRRAILIAYGLWFGGYALFFLFGTGPEDLAAYPAAETSPYRLPWRAGVTHLVGQGNRSFSSHRGNHLHAWDFWMSVGTEIVAARGGNVIAVEDRFDGIGLESNYVTIEHEDGTRAVYAHVRRGGVVVKVGDRVDRGQRIAESGMVGQTIYPHLHFVVQNREGTASIPISFAEVPNGVPRAGHSYASANGDVPPTR